MNPPIVPQPLRFVLLAAFLLANCTSPAAPQGPTANSPSSVFVDNSGTVVWARGATGGVGSSSWSGSAVDKEGNLYLVGSVFGNAGLDFGSTKITGARAATDNPVLLKVSPSGTVLWARTIGDGGDVGLFHAVAVDSAGRPWVVGSVYGTGTYSFGTHTVQGPSYFQNAILAEYDTEGSDLLAVTVAASSNATAFNGVAIGADDTVYAVGSATGTAFSGVNVAWTSPSGTLTVTGGAKSTSNALVAAFDPQGRVLWAQTPSVAPDFSSFEAAAVGPSGSLAVVGQISGTQKFEFGDQSIQGPNSYITAFVVQYAATGEPEWIRAASQTPGYSTFSAVAVDEKNQVWAAGSTQWKGTVSWGQFSATAPTSGLNSLLVRFDPLGTPESINSAEVGTGSSRFNAVTSDGNGHVFVAGQLEGKGSYVFGGVTVQGKSSLDNLLLLKLDAEGQISWVWTESSSTGTTNSRFDAIAADTRTGTVTASGTLNGAGVLGLSPVWYGGVDDADNAVSVQFR